MIGLEKLRCPRPGAEFEVSILAGFPRTRRGVAPNRPQFQSLSAFRMGIFDGAEFMRQVTGAGLKENIMATPVKPVGESAQKRRKEDR